MSTSVKDFSSLGDLMEKAIHGRNKVQSNLEYSLGKLSAKSVKAAKKVAKLEEDLNPGATGTPLSAKYEEKTRLNVSCTHSC